MRDEQQGINGGPDDDDPLAVLERKLAAQRGGAAPDTTSDPLAVLEAKHQRPAASPSPAPRARTIAPPSLAPRDATSAPPTARATYRPNLLERAGGQVAEFAHEAVKHPGRTAAELVLAPARSLLQATGGALERGFTDAGGEPDRRAITDEEYSNAAAQTVANVAFGPLESAVASRAASLGLAKGAGRVAGLTVAGVPAGAAYSPDDPAAGAVAGGLLSALLGGAHEGVARSAPVVRDVAAKGAKVAGAGAQVFGAAGRDLRAALPSLRRADAPDPLAARAPDPHPKLSDVDAAIAELRREHQAATEPLLRGELESRLGVLEGQRRALTGEPAAQEAGVRSLDQAPPIDVPPSRTTDAVVTVEPEAVKPTIPAPDVEATPPTTERPTVKRSRGVKLEDEDGVSRYEAARTESGGRRKVEDVSTRGLLSELIDMETKRADAESRSVYEIREDKSFATSGIPQIVSTKGTGGGPSMQAKGLRNLADYSRMTDDIHAGLERRGLAQDDVFDRVEGLRTEQAERAGQAGDFDSRNINRDMVTDEQGRALFDPGPSREPLAQPDPLSRMERDLFGEAVPDKTPEQGSMFGEREGTEASRSLRDTEASARSELDRLVAEQRMETDGGAYQARAKRITQLDALVKRGEKIDGAELAQRAAAEGRRLTEGPDQGALFSPFLDAASAIGKKYRAETGGRLGLGVEQRVEPLRKISTALAEGVGVPLREGRFRAAQRKALGVFFPHAEVARLVRMDKIDTAAHEVGHYVSKEYLRNPTMKGAANRGAEKLSVTALRELVQLGKDLYGTRKPHGGYGEEGIAQWARFYVTEHARLAREAPEFSRWMDEHVLKQEPMLQQSLDVARRMYEDHQNAPATARVDAMISVNDQSRLAEGLRYITTPDKRAWLARKLVTWSLDDLNEFKLAVKELGGAKSPKEDAYILARLTRGAAGMAEEMLDRGVVNPRTGARMSPALHSVLESLKPEELQPFRRYLVAQRAIELAGRGVDAGINMADAHEIVGLYDAQFRTRAEQVWQVSQSLIDYRVAKGLLTSAEGQAIKDANQRRVGFFRVFGDEETGGRKGTGKGFGRNNSGIQRAVGSSREIIDPLESIITDVYRTVQQSHAHEAALTLYKSALETEGGGRIIEEVPAPQVPVEIPVERVKQQLIDLGFEPPDGGLSEMSGVLSSFQDATMPGAREAKDMVLSVVIDGERKWLAIKDAQLYDALQGLNPQQLPAWQRLAGAPTRVLRAGATLTLEFIARNPARDAFTAAINSQGPTRPPGYLAVEGLFHVAKRDDLFQRWRLAGGDNAQMLGLDRATVQKNLHQLTRSTHGKAIDLVVHPIDALRMISGLMENATRVGEFAAVSRKLERGGMPRADANVAAGYASREVTLDFAKGGQVSRAANSLVSFFNANLLGNAKLLQELRARPEVVAPRIAAMITLPSITLYLAQRNDPAYQEVPQWQKDVSWVIVQRDHEGKLQHIWRIPKPPELGILFGSTFERALQFMDSHDPKALDGLAGDLLDKMNPMHMPDALRPFVEWWGNKSLFRDRPIVPAGMTRLPAAEQSTRYTGETARLVGRLTNTSPAKIENAVQGTTAGLGTLGLQGADAVVRGGRRLLGQPPLAGAEAHLGDWTTRTPLIRGFAVRKPSYDAESVQRTLNDFREADSHRLAWMRKLKAGDKAGAAEYLAEHRDAIASVATHDDNDGSPGKLRAVYTAITQLQRQSAKAASDVRDPERLGPIQDRITEQMVALAREYRGSVYRPAEPTRKARLTRKARP